ncbi:SCO family protein [Chitinimonas arctica]|uniref:SCO family protein n=1 Tax=Chitinimonas arctica TaxID=2594795 RepID=A0A516SH94_9NEIS|nr:SCO family protein [Chitinimonas arctica]QDQ27490.1 SCO family protein [Chitinimonas arctica]
MRRFLSLALTLIVLGLAACGQKSGPAFKSTDITGAPFGGEFRLTGHDGKPHALADFRGKAVVLFFGYTHCPDVCPTTMSELAGAMKQLGERAKDVQVLFVTVDPERDTQALLNQYVPSFHPAFIGLRGSPAETRAVADQFKVVYQKNVTDKTNYTVDHSAGSYIFDKAGKLRLFVSYGAGAEVFSHDLGLLLAD